MLLCGTCLHWSTCCGILHTELQLNRLRNKENAGRNSSSPTNKLRLSLSWFPQNSLQFDGCFCRNSAPISRKSHTHFIRHYWSVTYGRLVGRTWAAYKAFFLDAFAKLRIANLSFVMFVCMSVRPHWRTERINTKFKIWVFSENMSRKLSFY
jgi:hypothetical protein